VIERFGYENHPQVIQ